MNSQTCKQIQAELLDYCEQELPAEDCERVAEHLAHCELCNMEYKGLRAMLEKTKHLSIEDPGEAFWRQLPQNVLQQVKQARQAQSASPGDKIVDLSSRRQSPGNEPNPQSIHSHHPTNLKKHRLSAAFAIAASVLLVVNVLMFSPKAGLWLDQGVLQANLKTQNLSALVQTVAQSSPKQAAARLGFVEQQRIDLAFSAGLTLAETFAYVQGGEYSLAQEYLQQLQQGLQRYGVSAVTLSSLRKARESLLAAPPQPKQTLRLLTQFQRDYENYLNHTVPQQVVLYRAGIWMFNLNLAVTAKDAKVVGMLADPEQLDYLHSGFSRLNAPPGVHRTLQQIGKEAHRLNGPAVVSEQPYRSLKHSLENLYSLLG